MGLREWQGREASRVPARILAGRYRLDALIGSGGAADVHRGFDLRLRRPVAVKIFRPGTGFDTEENFRRETVNLARLQHQGLVTAYDAGRHDHDAYLVMQLVDGPTLKTRTAEGPLPCETVAALGADLADALAHAHQAGIVHRDVKPSNILLDTAGRPHLTDFGISRLLDATTRTATGTLTGTAAYLSPEQVLGRPVGRSADVYALGLVLLETLTGRLEYGGGPLEAAIARLHRQPALPDFLPDAFATLLRNMTALDERTRPTARHCARALARLASTATATETAPSAARLTSVVTPVAVTDGTDSTHHSPLSGARPLSAAVLPTARSGAVSRPAHAGNRLRACGAVAALAAVVASGLVATAADDGAPGRAAPSGSDPAALSASPDTAPREDDRSARPAAPPPPTRAASAPPLRASAPERDARLPSGGPGQHPATGATPSSAPGGTGVPEQSSARADGRARAKSPGEPHGRARKGQEGANGPHGQE
ncbi:serine/threonine-protein kinase [Streptomyces sp. NPDC093094]|uniref:serine/threonine-protein kinase n=1 Tax=Streptomyces sp. NPDC093094 TaxID=3366026 RepID=UPI0037F8A948